VTGSELSYESRFTVKLNRQKNALVLEHNLILCRSKKQGGRRSRGERLQRSELIYKYIFCKNCCRATARLFLKVMNRSFSGMCAYTTACTLAECERRRMEQQTGCQKGERGGRKIPLASTLLEEQVRERENAV